ncbi:pyridoxamine 5'-phosphate oxidase family protein [Mailhella sp.]|uniref:pyridoxamine 5'-phosphate oxidase family protein n=1 Tax=Mailhella sp. TaxID=1981029 RepID=UPI003AB68D86
MRRKDREINEFSQIVAVMRQCTVCHVAFFDEAYPYVIPMTFGVEEKGGNVSLYFHGAKVGHKHDLLQKNNHVAFSMELSYGLSTGPHVGECECTMKFDSVCGTGLIEYVAEEEKVFALKSILEHYRVTEGASYHFHEEVVPSLAVLKLAVLSMTGKRRVVDEDVRR